MSTKGSELTNTRESDSDFLRELKCLGADWRYSDEFIGLVVRARYPCDYGDIHLTQAKTIEALNGRKSAS